MTNFTQGVGSLSKPILSLVALGMASLVAGCTKGMPPVAPPKPPEVAYVHPTNDLVRDYEDFTGRIEAAKTVNVVPQVSGKLTKIWFDDGVEVKSGDDLFTIDPRPYQAALDSASATLKQMQADMKLQKTLLDRAEDLHKKGTVAQEDLDRARASYEIAVARRDLAKAAQATAELNLEYCHIKAEIDGTISRRKVDPSNQLTAYTTMLTTIVKEDTLYANFDVDERTHLRLQRLDLTKTLGKRMDVGLADEDGFSLSGVVDFVENRFDSGTGTIRIRVVIDNPTRRQVVGKVLEPIFHAAQELAHFPLKEPPWDKRFLTPNMFVRVRFWIGEPGPATLVPEVALVSDQGVRHLFVINEKDEVEYRPVEIGLQQGNMRVVKNGVGPGDRVIVSGLQRVRAGVKVAATEKKEKKPPAAANGSQSPQNSPASSAGN